MNQILLIEKESKKSTVFNNKFSVESEYLIEELKLIDFSDLNQVYHVVKKQTIEHRTFKYFLCLMQQLFLIPLNKDASSKIWKNLISTLKELIHVKENNTTICDSGFFLLKILF